MRNWNVTSNNRSAAKRILNTWHDSRDVRIMPLAKLTLWLSHAVDTGLITDAGIERALRSASKAPEKQTPGNGHGEAPKDEDGKDDGGEAKDGQPEEQTQFERELKEAFDMGYDEAKQGGARDDQAYDEAAKQEAYEDGYNTAEQEQYGKDEEAKSGESKSQEEDAKEDEAKEEEEEEAKKDEEQKQKDEEEKQREEEEREEEQAKKERETWDGKHYAYSRVRKYIAAGLNVALVGAAGSGKSYLARQIAGDLEKEFYVNGAMMSKYDLIGYCDANGVYHSTPAHDAFVNGGVHCFDELDASAPEAVVAFNGMTDDQPFYTFPCGQKDQHEDYVAIACMNTYGNGATADYVGRFKQDAASMSRFVKVHVGYDRNVEAMIAGDNRDIAQRVWDLRDACEALGIRHIVSTRMIVFGIAARAEKATKKEIDEDIFFAGLDDGAVKQVKSQMLRIKKEREGC
jgi:cobaltochelatase CobS